MNIKRILPGPWTLLFIITIVLWLAALWWAIFVYGQPAPTPYRISSHPTYIAPTDDDE